MSIEQQIQKSGLPLEIQEHIKFSVMAFTITFDSGAQLGHTTLSEILTTKLIRAAQKSYKLGLAHGKLGIE